MEEAAASEEYPAIRKAGAAVPGHRSSPLGRLLRRWCERRPQALAFSGFWFSGHSFVEDLELVNLMGSLGLPVSFSTSKVTTSKGKKKGIQAPFEEVNTRTDDDVRICVNTVYREIDVLSMTVLEHSSPCCSSETALGYSEPCHDDTDRGKAVCQADDGRCLDGHGQDHCSEIHDFSKIPDEELTNQSHEAPQAGKKQNGSMAEVLELDQEVASTKKKKRVRRSQSYHSCQDMADNISNDIIKYWTQRYSLFSLFDSGIKMDEEGWFSVMPEPIAKHHASRVGAGVMVDCFTGVGGNAIQFATKCKHVIAIDIDPQKIDCAQHNASVYGVNDHIDFVVDDFIRIAPHLKGETAFMSPLWREPDYTKMDIYDMKAILKPCDGLVPIYNLKKKYSLFKLGTMIAPRIVMFLPSNIDLNQLADMALSVDPPWTVEVEKNFLNEKLKAITAYFEKQDGLGVQ